MFIIILSNTVHNDFIAIGALDTDDDVAGITARMDATFENSAVHFIEFSCNVSMTSATFFLIAASVLS